MHAVGVTLSHEQADYARRKAAEEGLADRVEIRVQDYRDVQDGPYDAIASIGMAEHGSQRARSQDTGVGSFTSFTDPDGNTWTVQQLPPPGSYDTPQA